MFKFSAKNDKMSFNLINKNQDSDNKCNNMNVNALARQYSSFVFLVSMKYLNDEEKCKHATIQIFKKLNNLFHKTDLQNIKAWLYLETKNYCAKRLI